MHEALTMMKLDFRSMKAERQQVLLFLIALPLLQFFSLRLGSSYTILEMFFLFHAYRVSHIQHQHSLHRLYRNLPLHPRNVVRGRYLYLALHGLGSVLLGLPYRCLLLQLTGSWSQASFFEAMSFNILGYLVLCFGLALITPQQMRYRYDHPSLRRFAVLLLFFLFLLLPFLIYGLDVVMNPFLYLLEISPLLAYLCAFLLGGLLLALSSRWAYRNYLQLLREER